MKHKAKGRLCGAVEVDLCVDMLQLRLCVRAASRRL